MARSRNYDDIHDNKVQEGVRSSSKILFIVIILSVLICAIAVLVWVRILETQDTVSATKKADTAQTQTVQEPEKAPEPPQIQVQAQTQTPSEPEVAVAEEPVQSEADLSIDSALNALSSQTPSEELSYITSSDYGTADEEDGSAVMEQGVEMKKPLIAQNLSISQQSSFSKDIVRYTEYRIKEGDSLISIAQSFGLSVQTIVSVNQIKSTMDIWIGSVLQIPDRDGTLYIVREGDTLLSIIQQYGLHISAKMLGDVNGISEDSLQVGQKLFIPYETLEASGTISAETGLSFIRPADGVTRGMYNIKVANPISNDSIQLDGILIQAEAGTPVWASEAGTVVDKGFNDNGSGFVKLMHSNGYTTFYNYLGEVLVETADSVEKGQTIALFADGTSNYNPPVIFFRIEQGGVAFDPDSFFD